GIGVRGREEPVVPGVQVHAALRRRLDPGADRDDAEAALRAVPGMTPRTAALIRLRALGDPDVAVPDDSMTDDAWRPWRSYARQHLTVEGQL
ncbi:3-methyladenine DNA glycosylase 2, partial [Streptomyces endophyticus]|nr:3-methyladenine DNA glycosylase 2 [Streptomyces endophyticus]